MSIRKIAAAFALALAAFVSTAVLAADLEVAEPWARASAGPARNGAAFLTLKNHGADADRLVAARADVADRVELHTHIMEGNLMKMREVEGGIAVPAGETVMLEPGGLHVMFMGLKAPFKEGEHFPLTLVFEKAGDIDVTVHVQGVADKKAMPQHGHSNMKMSQ